jgi:hypothetical protein
VCRAALAAPGAGPLDQARCPRCDAELWVLAFSEGPAFFPRRPGETPSDLLAALVGTLPGEKPGELEEALRGADSLDMVELLAEVEQQVRSGGPAGMGEAAGS